MTLPTDPDEVLKWLDENTDWDLPDEEDGDREPDPPPDTLDEDGAEEVANILDCIDGMEERGEIEDIIVIVNTTGEDQLLFTTFDDNQAIMGCLSTAQLNWWNTQRVLGYIDEEGGDDEELCGDYS